MVSFHVENTYSDCKINDPKRTIKKNIAIRFI